MKIMMVDGAFLGELKIKREVCLIDIYDTVMAALGGSMGYTHEPRLVSPCEIAYDGAYQRPFSFASDGDNYTLIKAKLQDTASLDRDRRRRKE